jgi:hypothetical protein
MKPRHDQTVRLLKAAIKAKMQLEIQKIRERYDAMVSGLETDPTAIEHLLFGDAGAPLQVATSNVDQHVKLANPPPSRPSVVVEEYIGDTLKLQRGDQYVNERTVVRSGLAITEAHLR